MIGCGLMCQVIKLMRDKIAYLSESMDKFRPRESNVRNSLAAELQFLEGQLAESRLLFKLISIYISLICFCSYYRPWTCQCSSVDNALGPRVHWSVTYLSCQV